VKDASVAVEGQEIGRIGRGLVIFLGFGRTDEEADFRYVSGKAVNVRIFPDELKRFNCSALDVGAALLLISQFTLISDTRRGRRPNFTKAAPALEAYPMYDRVVALFRKTGLPVSTGLFQKEMQVSMTNDGPVTFLLDSVERHHGRR
jgi:D-tyrosyl-tRNA(Tyr) deacylase